VTPGPGDRADAKNDNRYNDEAADHRTLPLFENNRMSS